MKRGLWLIIFLFLIVSVHAQKESIQVSVKSVNERVQVGETAEFQLFITNDQLRDDNLRVGADDFSVYPFSEFAKSITAEPAEFYVSSHETKAVTIKIVVNDKARPGINHNSLIRIVSTQHSEVKKDITLSTFVVSPRNILEVNPEIPSSVVPGRTVPFKIIFKNRADAELKNVEVYLTSEIFSDSKSFSFEPKETREEEFEFDVSGYTKPGDYVLSIRAYKDRDLKGEASTVFSVVANPDVKEKRDVVRGFLSSEVIIKTRNEGNSKIDKMVELPVSFLQGWFSSSEPDAEKKNGKLVWEFTLEPGDVKEIKVKMDYKVPLLVLILILVFIWVVWYYLTRGVSVVKKIYRVRGLEGITELRIMLQIKNTGGEARNLKVFDIIPALVKPSKEFATLKPGNIQKGTRGTRLVWDIDSLDKGEERIISYQVVPELSLVGPISLPGATVQYLNDKGENVLVKSNRASYTPRGQ